MAAAKRKIGISSVLQTSKLYDFLLQLKEKLSTSNLEYWVNPEASIEVDNIQPAQIEQS